MLRWDEAKSVANLAKYGVPFEASREFDWETALVVTDSRRDYGETRYEATGFIGPRLFILVFTMRGDDRRVISLRKANSREVRHYAKAQPQD